MANDTVAYINGAGPYQCAYGASFSDEYNETLDSASIIIPNLSSRISPLAPYMSACVQCAGQELYYLVESFSEQCVSPSKGIWTYTIRLMSCTKLLEKVQCPNLCVTHGEASRRTIYEVIHDWLTRYNIRSAWKFPNGASWAVENLIWIPEEGTTEASDALYAKFNVPCGDMQLSAPTLRQALTTLMAQVSCIPKLVYNSDMGFYELSYLDFAETRETQYLTDAMIATRSQSADSYANTLWNPSGGMLDDDGLAICERLHFTDRENLLLKHLENLKLETRFPIYKVKKLTAYATCDRGDAPYLTNFAFTNAPAPVGDSYQYSHVVFYADEVAGNYSLGFIGYGTIADLTIKGTLYILNAQGEIASSTAISTTVSSLSTAYAYIDEQAPQYAYKDIFGYESVYEKYGKSSDFEVVFVGACTYTETTSEGTEAERSGTLVLDNRLNRYPDADGTSTRTRYDGQIREYQNDSGVGLEGNSPQPYKAVPSGFTASDGEIIYAYGSASSKALDGCYADITPLVYEASARSGLDIDYVALSNETFPTTVDTFAKYYYSTLSYSVGGNEITGFSQNYSVTNGWWSETHSVIVSIAKNLTGWKSFDYTGITYGDALKVLGISEDVEKLFGMSETLTKASTGASVDTAFRGVILVGDLSPVDVSGDALVNPLTGDDTFLYSTLTFRVEYIPLSEASVRFSSHIDDTGMRLEQYDAKQSGTSSFESVCASEMDSVRRITSDVLSIQHRTKTPGERLELNTPIYCAGERYVIFQRQTNAYRNDCMTLYMASRDYVMKNYYTSIMTKYRAYQYVDYSSSTLRHENERYFINVSYEEPSACASKAITFNNCTLFSLINGAWTDGEATPLFMRVEKWGNSSGGYYQDEISVSTANGVLAITAQDFDNASLGIYIDGSYISGDNEDSTDLLGGLPQRWYEAQSEGDGGGMATLKKIAFAHGGTYWSSIANGEDALALPLTDGLSEEADVYIALNRLSGYRKDGAERFGITLEFEMNDYTGKEWQFAEKAFGMSSLVGRFSDEAHGASADFEKYIITDEDIDITQVKWVLASSLTAVTASVAQIFAVTHDGDAKIAVQASSSALSGVSHPVVWAVFGDYATPVMKGKSGTKAYIYLSEVGEVGLTPMPYGLRTEVM